MAQRYKENKGVSSGKEEREIAQAFFESQMQYIGVNDTNNTFEIIDPFAEYPVSSRRKEKIFTATDKGYDILFWRLNREIKRYYTGKNQKPHIWKQTRLKEPKGDMKYQFPSGQGQMPFIPPLLVKSYEGKLDVPVLILTEGAKKAFTASQYNLPVIGLTSITHYRDSETNGLHSDIEAIIRECNVKILIILWDADCKDISDKALSIGEDLANRPFTFYNSISKIREVALNIEDVDLDIHFFHVASDLESSPKGLDDLLHEALKLNRIEEVGNDLSSLKSKGIHFNKQNITSDTSLRRLKKEFGLNKATTFYDLHGEKIANRKFVFRNAIYQWNSELDKVEELMQQWASDFFYIGDEIFEQVPDEYGNYKLICRNKATLKDRFGKDYMKHVLMNKYFHGFVNLPDNFHYKRMIEKGSKQFYNRYSPLRFKPETGDCSQTIAMIKHLFGEQIIEHKGKQYKGYELGLDYLQLLLTNPMQRLPVLILYSKLRNTGKSTLGIWLMMLLGNNAAKVSSSHFSSDFNEIFADKLLVYCDETLLDRKAQAERIKDLSMSKTITVNPKGSKMFSLPFFAKFLFISNNEGMIYADRNSERFWIVEVPKLEKDIPNFDVNLEKEIPAFLDFILERELVTNTESRMHFHKDLIRTEAFHKTVEANEPKDVVELRDSLNELFHQMDEDMRGEDEILIPMKEINEVFFGGRKLDKKWLKKILRDHLEVEMKKGADGRSKVVNGSFWKLKESLNGLETVATEEVHFRGRPFVFTKAQFAPEIVTGK